ncbi:glycosyltransferase family 2 protein [Owenweeksia hongkongensis]|uniref:glycosyltransferase family 2 protein n=1 Tax=Owenweeksia hongkongensis TaxID=253245 RepID=UPI003A94D491
MGFFIPPKDIVEIQKLQNKSLSEIDSSVIQKIKSDVKQNVSSSKAEISIVVIAYNEENQILACVASLARSQANLPVEVIVVNNNSNDNTQLILDTIGVKSIIETKQGYGFARQAGLEAASGKYVLTCDADTLYQPEWAQKMIEPLEAEEGVIETYSFGSYYADNFKYDFGLLLYQYIKFGNFLMLHRKRPHLNVRGFSMAFRKHDVVNAGGYANKEGRGEDGMLSFELSQVGKLVLVRDSKAVVYTSSRGVLIDGSLYKGFIKRAKDNLSYLHNYFTSAKPE